MLDVKTARDILPLVNTPDFEELFNLYLDSKRHDALRVLEQSDDEIEIYAYIGHTQSTSSYQAANSTHVTLFKINNA